MSTEEIGYCEGEQCNRNGCEGIIYEKYIEGSCSCHLSAPCGYCTEPRGQCTDCRWDDAEEVNESYLRDLEYWKNYHQRPEILEEKRLLEEQEKLFQKMYHGEIPVDKYSFRHRSHTHFSQIIYGVHPDLDQSEIREKIKGTFGGRFTRFNNYSFEYIAYTD